MRIDGEIMQTPAYACLIHTRTHALGARFQDKCVCMHHTLSKKCHASGKVMSLFPDARNLVREVSSANESGKDCNTLFLHMRRKASKHLVSSRRIRPHGSKAKFFHAFKDMAPRILRRRLQQKDQHIVYMLDTAEKFLYA